ncbi:hypothetical protein L7F22_025688 [Adiantum nelumboides]|nr:hypothetical protein [Adiantum nelumboides]
MEHLPKELLENVLRRLTVYDIIRAGCACKLLRALVSSSPPIQHRPHVTILLLRHPHALASELTIELPRLPAWAYDADRDAWLTLSLAFLQPYLPHLPNPVASDGGLLCFGSGCDFIICNPITKSWRRLPHLTEIYQWFDDDSVQAFGLHYISASGAYEFVLLNHWAPKSLSSKSIVATFSSTSSQWVCGLPLTMPVGCKLHNDTIISWNSRLYSLWTRKGVLVMFSFFEGTWTEVEVPMLEYPLTLLKAFLLEVNGSLYMVGGVGPVWHHNNYREQPTTMRIWKMLAPSDVWEESTRMPYLVFREFEQRIDFDCIQCLGKNGVMYLKGSLSDCLMFDFNRDEWKWLKDLEMVVSPGELNKANFVKEGIYFLIVQRWHAGINSVH